MDAQVGPQHLPLSKSGTELLRTPVAFLQRCLLLGLFAFFLWAFFLGNQSWASKGQVKDSSGSLHYSGDRTRIDFRSNIIELEGNAFVNRGDEHLRAHRIILNMDERTVWAKGDCYYHQGMVEIQCEEIKFSLDTSSGSVVGGRVTNGNFLLVGDRINKLSKTRYQTFRGEYTTCKDCPGSWSLYGADVDLEFGGYAYISGAVAKIKDVPFFWFPYLVVPLKTERETGFLFPRFGFGAGAGGHGVTFVQDFFWATSRSADMTLGLGTFSNRGMRAEWEGRYRLSENSAGNMNVYYTRDKTFPVRSNTSRKDRYGLAFSQSQDLPWGLHQKLQVNHISDNYYPIDFSGDVVGYRYPVMTSKVMLSHAGENVSSFVEARHFRNLLYFGPNDSALVPLGIDARTVQLLPRFNMTSNDQFLESWPVNVGLTLGLSNFTRAAAPFDEDDLDSGNLPGFDPGQDPIREALRLNMDSHISYTFRLFDTLALVPSVTYRGYYYAFDDSFAGTVPNFWRGYLLLQSEFSFQMEKIYKSDESSKKFKHTIRPTLLYSLIPLENSPVDHAFVQQLGRTDRDGYYFDNNDRVPKGEPTLENYFTPLGHSISYGVITQLFEKKAPIVPVLTPQKPGQLLQPQLNRRTLNEEIGEVTRVLDIRAGQTIDFLELKKSDSENSIPFSRLFASKSLTYSAFSWQTTYFYYPRVERYEDVITDPLPHDIYTSLTFEFEEARQVALQDFRREISIAFSRTKLTKDVSNIILRAHYAINDNFTPSMGMDYNLITSEAQEAFARILIVPNARCWNLDLSFMWDFQRSDVFTFRINFNLNLTGDGWGMGII